MVAGELTGVAPLGAGVGPVHRGLMLRPGGWWGAQCSVIRETVGVSVSLTAVTTPQTRAQATDVVPLVLEASVKVTVWPGCSSRGLSPWGADAGFTLCPHAVVLCVRVLISSRKDTSWIRWIRATLTPSFQLSYLVKDPHLCACHVVRCWDYGFST